MSECQWFMWGPMFQSVQAVHTIVAAACPDDTAQSNQIHAVFAGRGSNNWSRFVGRWNLNGS